jgi:hypothetical protein
MLLYILFYVVEALDTHIPFFDEKTCFDQSIFFLCKVNQGRNFLLYSILYGGIFTSITTDKACPSEPVSHP